MDRAKAVAFVEAYGRTWESWDVERFVELFADGVLYVAHPDETVIGTEALTEYVRKEQAAQGEVQVRMGTPIVEGDRVVAEFWVTATNQGQDASIAGCLLAQLDPADGRCTRFREYWFDLDGKRSPFEGWGD
jgi:hypothetical protein